MKKIRWYLCTVLLVLSAAAVTACGRNSGNGQTDGSVASESSSAGSISGVVGGTGSDETGGEGSGVNGSANGTAAGGDSADSGTKGSTTVREESSGVLDDLMDDVEQGLHDMDGDSEGPSHNADESGR